MCPGEGGRMAWVNVVEKNKVRPGSWISHLAAILEPILFAARARQTFAMTIAASPGTRSTSVIQIGNQ